ncbi:MAG: glycosyltransferase family 4 protein, partial [Nitrospiraceae bacterium]
MTRLKLCFVGPAASISLRRWTEWFATRGHQCTVMTVEPAVPAQAAKFEQINLTTSCGPRKIGRIVSVLKMIRCIRELQPDLVHIHYLRGLPWGLLADLPRPCVVTPWGSDVLPDQGAYREWYSKGLTGRLLRWADLVTTHSSYMEEEVRALVPDVRSIVRVGWGVNLQRFRPNLDTASLRRRWEIQADQPVVFSPRLLQPLYNHEYIIQALPRLQRTIPNVIVVFTDYFADLAYKGRLQQLAADLDVLESIRFVG